jgi:hypothetical protein
MPSLEIFEVRVRVHDVTAREPCGLGRRQLPGDRVGDLFSKLTLQCEYVFELSVVTIGQSVSSVRAAMSWTFNRTPPTRCAEPSNRLHVQFPGVSGSDNGSPYSSRTSSR